MRVRAWDWIRSRSFLTAWQVRGAGREFVRIDSGPGGRGFDRMLGFAVRVLVFGWLLFFEYDTASYVALVI